VLFASDQNAGSDTSPFLDGVMAVVDLYSRKVIRFHDIAGAQSLHVPHDVFDANLRSSIAAAHPAVPVPSDRRNFAIDGNVVTWQDWRFRFNFNLREGLVLHQIGFNDSGHTRPILYRASVSEVLTAYGDPNEFWSWMQILDEGIFGLGYLSMAVQPGQQVPSNAITLGAVMPDPTLPPFSDLFADRIYVYERDGGNLINYRYRGRTVHARATELVIGSLVSLGNYVYGFNWVFKQDGSFAFEAELSGSILTKFVGANACDTCAAIAQGPGPNGESRIYEPSGADKNGGLVYPNLVGVSHQHWFNLRLDFDIDGSKNAVMENNVKRPARARPSAATANAAPLEVAHTVLSRAVEAKRRMNHDTSRTWTIYNPSALNGSRRPAGYTLMPLHNTATALPRSQEPETVGFTFHHVWVTPYRDGQLYAAGAYPNQAKSDYTDTLYSYADNSSVYDKDVVVWYSMGDTHVPRPEDFPLMTSKKLSVVFHPDGFFQQNPLFVPPDTEAKP
jgi:primary-amine oxidase